MRAYPEQPMTVEYGPPSVLPGYGEDLEQDFEQEVIEGTVVPRAVAIVAGVGSLIVAAGSLVYAAWSSRR